MTGTVIKGRVSGATVRVYLLEQGTTQGPLIATTTTDEAGAFTAGVAAAAGPFVIVASGGSYVDEATGNATPLSETLTALVPRHSPGADQVIQVSPISHFVAALTRWHQHQGVDLATAYDLATTHLNAHFAGVPWQSAMPADLTTTAVTSLDESARAGLLLAALSQQARLISEQLGLTPGARVTAHSLTEALHQDLLADGRLNGVGPSGALVLPPGAVLPAAYQLSGTTARRELAHAVARFIAGERNAAKALRPADIETLASALSSSSDPMLFDTPGSAVDVQPPRVSILTPVDGAGVYGSITVEAEATDESAIRAFTWTAPPGLTSVQPSLNGSKAQLSSTLDVSALPDGPLELVAVAEDVNGNRTTARRAVVVSNRGPTINVDSPAPSAVLSGSVRIAASATARQGVVRRLELRDPPPGIGADTLPAADAYAATWDTLKAREGRQVITFLATDEYGATTESSVLVVLDNVPFGRFDVAVSAGTPLAGATVKVLAIDPATGQPVTSRSPILGQGGPTTDGGTVLVTLTEENWEGPVQLQATGATSYTDPSDPAGAQVSLATNVVLSSYLPHYRTGDAVTAPVTLYTSLADTAAVAFATGRNSDYPPSSVPEALTATGSLFAAHVSGNTPWDIRTVVPAPLTQAGTQALRDVVFAAAPDVALNELARRIATAAGLTPVSGFDAIKLLQLLQQDVSDGRFDGRMGATQLRVLGTPSYSLSAQDLRVHLALALDSFVMSPRNSTGLTRGDFRSASPNVYDAMCLDTSALFDRETPPRAFDITPPSLALTLTFTGDDGTPRTVASVDGAPVANTVTVRVTAADLEGSGVRGLTVTAAGRPLDAVEQTATTYEGTLTPTADGNIELVATAEDGLGNRATLRRVVRVDNTPPAVSVTAPAVGGHYGLGPVTLAATANDASDIASHSVSGLPGSAATSGLASLTGTWTPPAGTADGSYSATWSACDTVGNCRSSLVPFKLDRTPPALTLSPEPPLFTNAANHTFVVRATDSGAGVTAVYARRATNPTEALPASLVDGTWRVTVPMPLTDGATPILIWAEDGATPRNSGINYPDTAALLSRTITRDTLSPGITLVAGGRYLSESGIQHQESSPGVPVMPVQYTGLSTLTQLGHGSVIHKATTRLTPPSLTYAELTTTNGSNTPWLAYQAPVAATEAGIASVRYSIACASCSPSQSEGDALVSPVENGFQRFALPLTAATVPGLPTAPTASVTLTITVTATDAAGNSATTPAAVLTFNLVTPALSLSHEANYPVSHDPKSIFGYKVAIGTYDELWSPTTPAFEGTTVMRIARFVVRNPHPVPVAVNLSPSGPASWSLTEDWSNQPAADANTSNVSADGFTFARTINYDFTLNYALCKGIPPPPVYPCQIDPGMGTPIETMLHEFGSATQWRCLSTGTSAGSTNYASGTWDSVGYLSPWSGGGEPEAQRAPASFPINGRAAWLVPPAVGTTPGQLVLYAVLPRSRGTLPTFTGSDVYQYLYAYSYGTGESAGTCRDGDGNISTLTRLTRGLLYRKMTSARLSTAWLWNLAAAATRSDGVSLGGVRAVTSGSLDANVDLTRN
ncbi:hypothetical protein HUA74_43940 [Myxococcus sp. CA051A]|uniref:hypothetical protein n=1 Tax=Myxococcus sp. CA051A TaxID=2741739 RepID=UPI00157A4D14|nr:hypothetical protein [Myxococcus sp. CA051A]NTX67621.1 hypothetical protein [Myxococcus sp. CA051A]